jgi:hypothetical protein
MASKTKKTTRIRKVKLAKKGKVRKALDRAKGSTRSYAELFGDK